MCREHYFMCPNLFKVLFYKILQNFIDTPPIVDSLSASDLDFLKKQRSEEECFDELREYIASKKKLEKKLKREMDLFKKELVERGINKNDIDILSSADPFWAQQFHVLTFLSYDTYSPRAHFISVLVQELDVINNFINFFNNQLREAEMRSVYFQKEFERAYAEIGDLEFLDTDNIPNFSWGEQNFEGLPVKIQKYSDDFDLWKKLKTDLPQLPPFGNMGNHKLNLLIKRLLAGLDPTVAAKTKKENEEATKRIIEFLRKYVEKNKDKNDENS